MFDFTDLPDDDALRTSWGRFLDRRITWWGTVGNWTWWPRHHFWWLIHNVVAHLLIAFLPFESFFKFHDWTSKRLAGDHLNVYDYGRPWWQQLFGKKNKELM